MRIRGFIRVLKVTVYSGAIILFAAPLDARNITAEIQYYRQITVEFSEKATFCGFSDPEPFRDLAKTKLSAMDIPAYSDALTEVAIQITAAPGGILKQNCATHIGLKLQVPFATEFLDANAYEGKDQIFGMLSHRVYKFPMVYYDSGIVFGDYPQMTPDRALEALGSLLDGLATSRIEK